MTAQALTLTEFLLARIAEDEAAAQALTERSWPQRVADALWAASDPDDEDPPGSVNPLHDAGWDDAWDLGRSVQQATRAAGCYWLGHPARVLAECEAKRRIVEECRLLEDYDESASALAEAVLDHLALPYVDHPDYAAVLRHAEQVEQRRAEAAQRAIDEWKAAHPLEAREGGGLRRR